MINRLQVFQTELNYIHNQTIRRFAETAIQLLPDYFFEVSSSSTGKYHPAYALGVGGLVRHTKAACKFADELLRLEMYAAHYSQDERDLMIVALLLHDGWKHGPEAQAGKYTVAEHPTVCAGWIKNTDALTSILPAEQIDFLCGCVASHMGEFCTDYRTKKQILPKPKTAAQKFVHQCDLLASRRWLIVDFGDDYYKGPSEEPKSDAAPDTVTNDDLQKTITPIVALCKKLIDNGVNRNAIYDVIAAKNGGNRNPNSISDINTANEILSALEVFSA